MPMPEPVHRRKPELSPLLEGYKPVKGVFDECIDEDGEMREAYVSFFEALPHFTSTEFKRRDEIMRRIIQEQGITYNVYGDPLGFDRPWQLDPLPLLISAAEWPELEKGLIQRAALINRIIADCYGSQDLIRSGWLPPALVFGQPDFLRPCHGTRPSGETMVGSEKENPTLPLAQRRSDDTAKRDFPSDTDALAGSPSGRAASKARRLGWRKD